MSRIPAKEGSNQTLFLLRYVQCRYDRDFDIFREFSFDSGFISSLPGNYLVPDHVRLILNVEEFLGLFTNGALAHKAARMAAGGERKEAAGAAQSLAALAEI